MSEPRQENEHVEPHHQNGDLIAIGGAEDKLSQAAILQRVLAQSSSRSPVVGVITTASNIPDVGYMDFPVSTMLPILCRKYGTRNASLENLLKCEHKFWSRSVMREAIPEHIPKFTASDPFDDNALSKIGEADLRKLNYAFTDIAE